MKPDEQVAFIGVLAVILLVTGYIVVDINSGMKSMGWLDSPLNLMGISLTIAQVLLLAVGTWVLYEEFK